MLNIMKATCCLVWPLQGLQAEQCPDADQGVGVGALPQVLHSDDLQVDAGDLQNKPLPPGLYPLLLHFRSLVFAAPADDSAAVSSPKNQVKTETGQNSCLNSKIIRIFKKGPARQAFAPGLHPDPCCHPPPAPP